MERLVSLPVNGLLSVNSDAGNSGGKPSEHDVTKAVKTKSANIISPEIFTYFAELFL